MCNNLFGERLRHLRERKKLTQTQVANQLGVNTNTISRFELGVHYPTMINLISLADLFGCSIDYLVGRE